MKKGARVVGAIIVMFAIYWICQESWPRKHARASLDIRKNEPAASQHEVKLKREGATPVASVSRSSVPNVAKYVLVTRNPSGPSYAMDIPLFLAAHPEYKINKATREQLQTAYLRLQEQRLTLEAKRAVVTKVSANDLLIEIPAYPAEGKRLLAEFDSVFSLPGLAGFGPKFQQGLENSVMASLGGLGDHPQEILATSLPNEHAVRFTRKIENLFGVATRVSVSVLRMSNLDVYSAYGKFLDGTIKLPIEK